MKRMRELGIHFNLKQMRDTEKLTQIMLAIKVGRKRVRVYTRLRVKPKYWDKSLYRCTQSPYLSLRDRMELQAINERLDALVMWLYEVDRRQADLGRYLDEADIHGAIDVVERGVEDGRSPIEVLRDLLADYQNEINRRGRKGVDRSKQTYLSAIQRLENYDRTRRQPLETLDDFNANYFEDFKAYLYRYTYGSKQLHYTQNTIVNTLKVVKNLLHRAYDRRLMRDDSFMRMQTVLPADVSDKIYLKRQEVKLMAKVKTYTQEEREVRDMFVIACHTALRFSDIQQLSHATFTKKHIRLYQQKTKEAVQVPIVSDIRQLLEHYQRVGFPTLKRDHVTSILCNLASRCHIDEPFTLREERGGEIVFVKGPKHKFVTFHTARRTCITNLYLAGYTANHIMSISGHRSIQSFMRYVKASGPEVSEQLTRSLEARHRM